MTPQYYLKIMNEQEQTYHNAFKHKKNGKFVPNNESLRSKIFITLTNDPQLTTPALYDMFGLDETTKNSIRIYKRQFFKEFPHLKHSRNKNPSNPEKQAFQERINNLKELYNIF